MSPHKSTDKYNMRLDIYNFLFTKDLNNINNISNSYFLLVTNYFNNGFNLCYCLEDCISIIPEFLFYQIKSVNIRDVKKHTEVPKPIQDYLNNNTHILEEIKEIYLMNMLE